jgi:hypothetical protein
MGSGGRGLSVLLLAAALQAVGRLWAAIAKC